MHRHPAGRLFSLGALRLERAIKRLRKQDRAGALDDLRAALVYMHGAGEDPVQARYLEAIIETVERQG